MKKISDIIPNLLPYTSSSKGKFAVQLCAYAWHRTVGKAINQNTEPTGFREGKLIVSVKNEQWKRQLEDMKSVFIKRINNLIEDEFIEDIEFLITKK